LNLELLRTFNNLIGFKIFFKDATALLSIYPCIAQPAPTFAAILVIHESHNPVPIDMDGKAVTNTPHY